MESRASIDRGWFAWSPERRVDGRVLTLSSSDSGLRAYVFTFGP